jgi:hypothetical protein
VHLFYLLFCLVVIAQLIQKEVKISKENIQLKVMTIEGVHPFTEVNFTDLVVSTAEMVSP